MVLYGGLQFGAFFFLWRKDRFYWAIVRPTTYGHGFMVHIRSMETIKTIQITGRKWFQRSYGNTYYSAVAHINGVKVAEIDFAYGYGDQYLQDMITLLESKGLIPAKPGHKANTWHLRDLCVPGGFTYHAVDVPRKKDL